MLYYARSMHATINRGRARSQTHWQRYCPRRAEKLAPALRATSSIELTERAESAAPSTADRHSVETRVVPIALLGKHAKMALAPGSTWSVLAIFRRSVYLRAAQGSVVCVGPLSLGAGPLNILAPLPSGLSWRDLGVTPTARVAWDGRTLRLDERLSFPVAQARLWRPVAPPADWNRVALSTGLDVLEAAWHLRAPMDGLAPMIPWLLTGRPSGVSVSGLNRALIEAAAPGIEVLRRWLASGIRCGRTQTHPFRAVESLIGLGPGLTPSGDDLLGGVLIALRALGWPQVADTLGWWLLPRARARTHAISYAHLASAAGGEGAAALHDTLATLCSPGAPGLRERADALTTLGHSSGWDAMAGMVLVATVAAASRSPERPGHVARPPCFSR